MYLSHELKTGDIKVSNNLTSVNASRVTEYYKFDDVDMVLEDLFFMEENIVNNDEIRILKKQSLSLINC